MVSEEDFIKEAINFVKTHGATGDYDIDYYGDVKVINIINPGWSISKSMSVREDLKEHMDEYCSSHDCEYLMDCVNLLIL